MPKGQAKPYPSFSVKAAAELAQRIRDTNAGKPFSRLLLADAMDRKPSSPQFRDLITAAGKYGFTEGSYTAETISLTDRGHRLTKPRSEEEYLAAMREAVRSIRIFEQLLRHFEGNRLPELKFLINTIERPPYSLPTADARVCADVFIQSSREVGFVRQISGTLRVLLDAGPPAESTAEEVPPKGSADADEEVDDPGPVSSPEGEIPAPLVARQRGADGRELPLQLFVAHGRKRGPVQELTKILTEFGIPFVVAEGEPHAGRPISQKVKDLMDSCTAGIFVFTADEKFTASDGEVVWRPRENVVYELGAGSYKYGTKIVVFKESEVRLPSDFQNIGYIEFQEGQLAAKTLELIRELVALKALKWTPGS